MTLQDHISCVLRATGHWQQFPTERPSRGWTEMPGSASCSQRILAWVASMPALGTVLLGLRDVHCRQQGRRLCTEIQSLVGLRKAAPISQH